MNLFGFKDITCEINEFVDSIRITYSKIISDGYFLA